MGLEILKNWVKLVILGIYFFYEDFMMERKGIFGLLSPLAIVCFFCCQAGAGPLKRPLTFQQFTPREGLSSEMVYAIAIQGDEIWFGTYGGGATFYDRVKKIWKAYTTKGDPMEKVDNGESIKWKNLLSYNHVSVIAPDVDRIWFGTYFYGFGGVGSPIFSLTRIPRGSLSAPTTVGQRKSFPWRSMANRSG